MDKVSISDVSLKAAHTWAQHVAEDADIDTPFLRRVANHMDIDDNCREYINSLQSAPMVFAPGTEVTRADAKAGQIFIVQMGWLISFTYTATGQRFIHRIYQPGDFIAIEDINWNYRTSSVSTVTACVLTAFTKDKLRRVFEESPRLSRTIFSIVAMTQVQGYDLQRSVSRLPAESRVADLLLQLRSRAEAAGTLDRKDELYCPLTQTEIGDAIGLTNVSVSRALSSLEEKGLIKRVGRMVKFRDMRELSRLADFTDRHDQIDREWIGNSDTDFTEKSLRRA